MKKRGKSRKNTNLSYSNLPINDKNFLIEAVDRAVKEKYGLNLDELFKTVNEKLSIPISVFNEKLTVLETVVKYLKEEKSLSLRKIGEILKRNEKNIWHTYNQTNKKYPKKFIFKKEKFVIPISIFSDNKLSAQESIVYYLRKELNFSYHQIAILLKRDDRTIWTVYSRAREKYGKQK